MDRLCLFLFFVACFVSLQSVQGGIGVNYGLLGDNLPTPDEVTALLRSRNIRKVRIFEPNPEVLKAFKGSDLEVVLGVHNLDLQQLSTDRNQATIWVNTHVVPHAETVKFTYISAGNEVIPGPLAAYVLGAMQNLHAALKAANLNVQVTTAVSLQVLGVSSPPSSGAFSDSAAAIMEPITKFLAANQSPLMINVYPYFAHVSDPKNIQLDFALFNQKGDSMTDGDLKYTNLFDAMVDATYTALEKADGATVGIVVSESGWPSAGNGDFATIGNAQTYVNNLVAHVSSGMGTPKRPGKSVETYLFAIFNENLKPAGAEQNFGLYYPDMSEVYHVDFSSKE